MDYVPLPTSVRQTESNQHDGSNDSFHAVRLGLATDIYSSIVAQ